MNLPGIRLETELGLGGIKLGVYGPPGIGKSSTMAKARNVLLLDTSGGLGFIPGYRPDTKNRLLGVAELRNVFQLLQTTPNHGVEAVLWDGPDALYARLVKGAGGDVRRDHFTVQRTFHPLLEDFFALENVHKIVVMNEHLEPIGDTQQRAITLDLAPRTTEIMLNRLDFMWHVEPHPEGSKVRTSPILSGNTLMAKTRYRNEKIKDGMLLSDVLTAVGIPVRERKAS